jgi:hypothetical protein
MTRHSMLEIVKVRADELNNRQGINQAGELIDPNKTTRPVVEELSVEKDNQQGVTCASLWFPWWGSPTPRPGRCATGPMTIGRHHANGH